jgi:hypothetical protein
MFPGFLSVSRVREFLSAIRSSPPLGKDFQIVWCAKVKNLVAVLWIRTRMDPHHLGNLDPHLDPHKNE